MSFIDRVISPRTRGLYARLLLDGARVHWKGYAAAMALLLVVSAATAAMAWIMKDVINELFIDRRTDMIFVIGVAVIGIFLARGLATYASSMILTKIGNRIVARLQSRMFAKLLRQDTGFFDTHSVGDVVVRLSQNASAARQAIEVLIVSLGRDLLSLIGLVAVMMLQNPWLSMIALVIAPPAVILVGWLTKHVRRIARGQIDAGARIISRIKEAYQGARIIKAFSLEERLGQRMSEEIEELRELSDNAVRYATLTVPMMDVLGGLAVGAVIMIAGWRIADGSADPGAFFSFLTALLLAYEPGRRLARLQVEMETRLVGVEMMYAFLDRPVVDLVAPGAAPLRLEAGRVELRDVHFSYGEAPALNGLDLECPGGKVTALVGPSGAGKSTVFELIERFRNPVSGAVLIDGQDIAAASLSDLRARIALVTQQTFLFAGAIRDNISHGRADAAEAEIEAAARAANAHDFIMAKPKGYDTPLGDEASALSGGERQRIAIARAMLRDAPILLLDEATSALDAESEAKVQQALERLMQGRTTLVIAHRLSTIRHADRIYVMEGGRAVECGTHYELLALGGAYARLHALQFGGAGGGGDRPQTPASAPQG